MLRLLDSLPASIVPAVACPPGGPFAAELALKGVDLLPIPGTALSFRFTTRSGLTGASGLVRSALALRAHAHRFRADVVHANGTRAGLLSTVVDLPRGPGVVVQVHDILPEGRVGDLVRQVLSRRAGRVVAVSRAATEAFNVGLRARLAHTTYISVDHARFHPGTHDVPATRRSLGVPEDARLLGVVAQITPWKGQLCAIDALARVREHHPDAHLVLAGSVAFSGPQVRYDNEAYNRSLHERVAELGLQEVVHFAGHRRDVADVMAALDLFLLPSWNEPFGTAIAEAMATGTVPLVTNEGGPQEFVEDGVSGRLLPPREPERWAEAINALLEDSGRRATMGAAASAAVARFTDGAYAGEMLVHYHAVCRR